MKCDENYIPFGDEWKAEVIRLPKKKLVDMFQESAVKATKFHDALVRIVQIEKKADGLRGSGMVDYSDIKAIRAMAKTAGDAILNVLENN